MLLTLNGIEKVRGSTPLISTIMKDRLSGIPFKRAASM